VAAAKGESRLMPSLFRLLVFLGMLGGIAYGALYSLAQYGERHPREITITITPDKYVKN
jgi:hypothetical protein